MWFATGNARPQMGRENQSGNSGATGSAAVIHEGGLVFSPELFQKGSRSGSG
jgi:hypothetical protein